MADRVDWTGGAVHWTSRGIGLDSTPGCFVCGLDADKNPLLRNIAAFVRKADEAAALACFERGARMAYFHGDRRAPQIKVGACDRHLKALERLSEQVLVSPAVVTKIVNDALVVDELTGKREGATPA